MRKLLTLSAVLGLSLASLSSFAATCKPVSISVINSSNHAVADNWYSASNEGFEAFVTHISIPYPKVSPYYGYIRAHHTYQFTECGLLPTKIGFGYATYPTSAGKKAAACAPVNRLLIQFDQKNGVNTHCGENGLSCHVQQSKDITKNGGTLAFYIQ